MAVFSATASQKTRTTKDQRGRVVGYIYISPPDTTLYRRLKTCRQNSGPVGECILFWPPFITAAAADASVIVHAASRASLSTTTTTATPISLVPRRHSNFVIAKRAITNGWQLAKAAVLQIAWTHKLHDNGVYFMQDTKKPQLRSTHTHTHTHQRETKTVTKT